MKLIGSLILALALGLITFVLILQFLESAQPEKEVIVKPEVVMEKIPKTDIWVARDDIPVGTVLAREHLDIQPWPSNLLLESFVQAEGETAQDIVGFITRATFMGGEPIIGPKLSNPDDPNFLASTLSEGMRAITISVGTLSAVAGFVFPGDRVDVLLIHDPVVVEAPDDDEDARDIKEKVAEILIPNARVIAVDQRTSVSSEDAIDVPGSVTLEVSRFQAQQLRLADKVGELSLALRSIKDSNTMDLVRPTALNDLTLLRPEAHYNDLYANTGDDVVTDLSFETESTGPSSTVTVIRGVNKESVGVIRQ